MLTRCGQNATLKIGSCPAGLTRPTAGIIMAAANPYFRAVSSDEARVTYQARISCVATRIQTPGTK